MPTKSDRANTITLAIQIVESVRKDTGMKLPLEIVPVHGAGQHYRRFDVESFVFQLAQEIVLLTTPPGEEDDDER